MVMMPVKWLFVVSSRYTRRVTTRKMVFGIIVVLYLTVGSASSLIDTPNTVPSPANDGGFMDQIGNLEQNIAAVFSKVAYGSTTTKRSIPDSVPIPNLTTVPSPLLTTFRYRERERDNGHDFESDQVINQSAYDLELEKDHALPTSAPNADILKSNSNPTYPNPNRHHNQDRHRLQSLPNSTDYARKGPTLPMFPGDMPSYAPPARSFFTPPLPPEYQNPFADKPTLRGTNSDLGAIHSSGGFHRRPIPPPSLVPGYERIPYRPPDLVPARPEDLSPDAGTGGEGGDIDPKYKKDEQHMYEIFRKKALNTPSIKTQDGKQQQIFVNVSESGSGTNAPSVGSGVLHFPSISRILSGSNGRKEDIPDILLRTVTVRPTAVPNTPTVTSVTHYQGMNLNKNRDAEMEMSTETNEMVSEPKKELRTTTPFVTDDDTFSTHRIQKLVNSDTPSTTVATTQPPPILSADRQSAMVTWTIAWNIHVYLSAILYTMLAVYSIFKMIFYDKLTHLFSQTYFIAIHMILISICLGRIFYLCYDAYNMHSSFTGFVSELLLNLPALMLAVTFATLILFLLLRSLNHKANRYSALLRPLTIGVGGGVHICLCITLHYVESYGVRSSGSGSGTKIYQERPAPRVLSLICQIIFIFVCLSLGTFYLYIYRVLKRVLRTKSQNYIHGYQNLSYAIHITIATALLFILMAALQVYGAVSISGKDDLDWLQWGYQFSLRLIEIAIVSLISWVGCLKTGTAKIQREKAVEQHISGFALFPCTSSSSQEHFETDYPAICNANTNLHTYTLRTGKPIYDDSFAVTPEAKVSATSTIAAAGADEFGHQAKETESINSQDGAADHYENPNFELQHTTMATSRHKDEMFDVCYSEPMHQYDFQNLERPTFERPNSRNEFRASKNLKVLKNDKRQHFNPYSSFERRPTPSTDDVGCHLGVRKSGTLGNIGHYHTNQNANTVNPLRRQDVPPSGRVTGVQTIQRPRYPPARYLQRQQDVTQSHHHHDKSTSANSSDDSVNSGSMLVAEHGFVRFRALDELEAAAAAATAAAAASSSGKDKRFLQS